MSKRKQLPPKFAPRFLQRPVPRLRARALLDKASKRPVVWVHAPAGTGKSTLVATLRHSVGRSRHGRVVWYNMDATDRDPAAFFFHFARALAFGAGATGRAAPVPPQFGPAHLANVSGYARAFFRSHWTAAKHPLVLVLDDWHEVDDSPALQEVLAELIREMPAGFRLYVTSWTAPPPDILSILADAVSVVGWDQIRFSDREAVALIRQRNPGFARSVPVGDLRRLNRYVGGWPSAIVLAAGGVPDSGYSENALRPELSQQLIDYLALRVFNRLPDVEREILSRIALLPRVSVRAAERLTGRRDVRRRLEILALRHRLIDPAGTGSYQVHTLLRRFLLEQLRSSSDPAHWSRSLISAAGIAAAEGLEETAVELLVEAGDWQGVVGVLSGCGSRLLNAGNYLTLRRWIEGMPGDVVREQPWLEFWLGSSLAPFMPREAQQHFTSAYPGFKRSRDLQGMFNACAAFLESATLEWRDFSACDSWIDRIIDLWNRHGRDLDPALQGRVCASVFAAMMWRRPEDATIEAWAQRLLPIAIGAPDVSLRILLICNLYVYYAVVIGDLARANGLLKLARLERLRGEVSPLARALWYSLRATGAWLAGEMRNSTALADAGSRVIEKEGLHVWDVLLATARVYATLTDSDYKRGAVFLDRLDDIVNRVRAVDHAHLLYLRCLYEIDRDPAAAVETEMQANALAEAAGGAQQVILGRLALAQALHAAGRSAEARPLLRAAITRSRRMGSHVQVFQALLCSALFALDSQDLRRYARDLTEALSIGREYGILNYNFFRPRMLARLLAHAVDIPFEQRTNEYIRTLVAKRGLAVHMDEVEETRAPVRIYTLGRFHIEGEDGVIALADARARFLHTLISLGVEGEKFEAVVSYYYLPPGRAKFPLDGPDSKDGLLSSRAAARGRIEAWINHLRKNLPKEMIDRSKGRICLRPEICWVDAFAFQQLAQRLLSGKVSGRMEGDQLRARLAQLAVGAFLPEEGAARVVAMRDRLDKLSESVLRTR